MRSPRRSAAPSARSCRASFTRARNCNTSCETFMKTFEQKWTAWVDGELTGKELAEFEAALPDKAAAEAEKRDAQKLGALLKQELAADVLSNEEFFSHQVRERIAHESAAPERRFATSTWWTLRRLAWSGAVSIAIFAVCALF